MSGSMPDEAYAEALKRERDKLKVVIDNAYVHIISMDGTEPVLTLSMDMYGPIPARQAAEILLSGLAETKARRAMHDRESSE